MNEQVSEERLHTSDVVEMAERQYTSKDTAVQSAEMKETALFNEDEAEDFRSRWNAIQTNFVDEPRLVVEEADSLVAQTIKRIAEVFADERTQLEEQWSRGDDVSTEDLRLTLQRYRSFFHRLLSV
jgi:hypothetical protein